MAQSFRRYSVLMFVASMVLLAGCGGGPGDATPTSTTPTVETYQADASEYLLDGEGFGESWEQTGSTEADQSPDGVESGQSVDLAGEDGNVTVTLLVFDEPSAASTHLENERQRYNDDGLQVADAADHDNGFRTETFEGESVYAVQHSNLYVLVTGDVDSSTASQLATEQLDAITGS